ncbi:MAG: hypothetical protein HY905_04480 [Deltaproteobacteria bacterium]|nr:hypothetical protein [Deltaproteobacteria bacterium]
MTTLADHPAEDDGRDRRSRRRAVVLLVLRVAGFLAIALLLTGLAWGRGPFRRAGGFSPTSGLVLPEGTAERFAPYSTPEPDERWGGCRLDGVAVELDTFHFDFRCPPAAALAVELWLSTGGGERYRIRATGTVTPERREDLLRRLRGVLDTLFPEPPFRFPYAITESDSFAGSVERFAGAEANSWLMLGLFGLLCAFLWACATGMLGRPDFVRRDLALLGAFAVALVLRLFLARHANSDVTLYFDPPSLDGLFSDKHSIVYPLFKMMSLILTSDPLGGLLRFNAVAGALTVAPLYLFVLRRTDDRFAALAAALLFSVHPTLVRIAPTDAHFALLLLCWCTGLAILSHRQLDGRRAFAGLVFLALAATFRVEGPIYLAVTPLLLGRDALRRLLAVRWALVAGLAIIAVLVGLQYLYKLSRWSTEVEAFTTGLAREAGVEGLQARLLGAIRIAGWEAPWSGPVLGALFGAGLAAGLLDRRRRAVLWLAGGWLLVALVGLRQVSVMSPLLMHRASPAFLLQVAVAGVGAAWLVERLAPQWRRRAGPPLLAAAVASVALLGAPVMFQEYAFNTEYRLLADHVAGLPRGECRLAFVRGTGDRGLFNPEVVVPNVRGIDCSIRDCVAAAREGGCLLYLRSGMCWRPPNGLPEPDGGRVGRLREPCATFEAAVRLSPIEETTATLRGSYADPSLPERAVFGLYRVRPLHPAPSFATP